MTYALQPLVQPVSRTSGSTCNIIGVKVNHSQDSTTSMNKESGLRKINSLTAAELAGEPHRDEIPPKLMCLLCGTTRNVLLALR